jgi:Flp pilus assembly protein TadG
MPVRLDLCRGIHFRGIDSRPEATLYLSPLSGAGSWRTNVGRPLADLILRLWRHEGGAAAILAGIAMLVLCGVVGLGVDLGMWYRTTRLMQNAADSAAVAASKDGTSAYQSVGQAVAAQYGFTTGVDNITVTVLDNQTCPDGETNCYSAAITQAAATQYFSTALGVSPPALSASAMAAAGQTLPIACLRLRAAEPIRPS